MPPLLLLGGVSAAAKAFWTISFCVGLFLFFPQRDKLVQTTFAFFCTTANFRRYRGWSAFLFCCSPGRSSFLRLIVLRLLGHLIFGDPLKIFENLCCCLSYTENVYRRLVQALSLCSYPSLTSLVFSLLSSQFLLPRGKNAARDVQATRGSIIKLRDLSRYRDPRAL